MSEAEDSSTAMKQRLMTAEEVYVYKIPPLKTAGGHRAEDWNLSEPLKTCELLVERRGDTLALDFTSDGALFCQSIVEAGQQTAHIVEQVVDSSRYFATKIQGAGGRQAMIGFGFRDREKATDLRESLQHYERALEREQASSHLKDFSVPSLGDGETIHVNRSGKSTITKEKKASSGAVPLLKKKPPAPSSSPEGGAHAKVDGAERISIAVGDIDLNASGGGGSDDDSGEAVYEGDDEQWATEFVMK